MSLARGAASAALFVASVLLAACVPSPEDPLDFGMLCVPSEDDCPSRTMLQRDVIGRNQVDYSVHNVGDSVAIVEVLALVPSAETETSLSDVDPDDVIARRELRPIAVGGSKDDRLTAQDLGVRDAFQLAVVCENCEVEVDWVFASVPRECFENDDCAGGWQCDGSLGRCVQCLVNDDCNEDQRCDLATGRCDPPDTTAGCTTSGGSFGLAGLLLFLLVMLARRRQTAGLVVPLTLLLLLSLPAEASPPRASIAVGSGARVLVGTLGPQTKRGVGLVISQELRWRYIGAGLSLATSYFVTRQEPPPFSRSFQTYGVTIGPRLYYPVAFLEFVAGPDYRRVGTANNSLVRFTGTRTTFDAVGGFGGIRFRWSGLEVRLEGGGHHFLQIDSTMLSADLSVGFTNVR